MRPAVSFITWQRHAGRAVEFADALGGRAVHVHQTRLSGSRARSLVRYAVSAVATAAHLLARRPGAVVVTNPPVVPGVVAVAYGALTRSPVVLDSHPASFGAKDNAVARRLLPVHRFLARRAEAVMVTTDAWVRVVEGWGGRGIVVHEAPPQWRVAPWRPPEGRPRVLFVGVFGTDEPVDVVLDAAAVLPDVDVLVTGDPAHSPQRLRPRLEHGLSPNVRLLGFLGPEDYRRAVEEAHVVLVLTTEPTSVVRAGYEAVYAGRPLVLTGSATLREVFPHAVHVENDAASVAAGIREALGRADQGAVMERALEQQQGRWDQQLQSLRAALGLPAAHARAEAGRARS